MQGLLFKPRLVLANLAGLKSETRRVGPHARRLLKLRPGDHVYQKETWRPFSETPTGGALGIQFRADGAEVYPWDAGVEWTEEQMLYLTETWMADYQRKGFKVDTYRRELMPWKSSLFLPAWAARVLLEVREAPWVESLQEITEAGAVAEGVRAAEGRARLTFSLLWDETNAERGFRWDENPEVVVVRYRVAERRDVDRAARFGDPMGGDGG